MIDLILADLEKVSGIKDLAVDDVIGEDEIFVNIDYQTADKVGLTAKDIGDTLRAAMSGDFTSEVTLANKDVNLKVRLDERFRHNLEDVKNLKVLNKEGKLISIGKVASFKKMAGVPQIKRFNNKRSKTITGNVDVDVITSQQANSLLKKFFEKHRDKIKGVSLYQGGVAESTAESMESLAEASIIAVFAIFGLLVFTFNSFFKTIYYSNNNSAWFTGHVYSFLSTR